MHYLWDVWPGGRTTRWAEGYHGGGEEFSLRGGESVMFAAAGGVHWFRSEGYDGGQWGGGERVRWIYSGNGCFVGEELGDEVLLKRLGVCEGSDSR